MLSHIQNVGHTLRAFIAGPQHTVLAVGCEDRDVIMLARIVQSMGREHRPEVVQLFVHAFATAAGYVDEIVRQLGLQLTAVQARLRADEAEPWPALPPEAGDSRRDPRERLRALMEWTAEVVDEPVVLAWALLPSQIDDLDAWEAFVAPLLPLEGPTPWLARHRVMVRDPLPEPRIAPRLAEHRAANARVMEIDLSPEKVHDDLVRRASDPHRPRAERIGIITQLAATDLAYGRLDDAESKYERLHAHHHAEAEVEGEIRCLQGLGDVALRRGEPSAALVRYQQGLERALQKEEDEDALPPERLPLILQLLLGASEAADADEQLQAAEIYCNSAQELAIKLVSYGPACDALTRLGAIRWRRGDPEGARKAWAEARDVAERYDDGDRLRLVDERQRELGATDTPGGQEART